VWRNIDVRESGYYGRHAITSAKVAIVKGRLGYELRPFRDIDQFSKLFKHENANFEDFISKYGKEMALNKSMAPTQRHSRLPQAGRRHKDLLISLLPLAREPVIDPGSSFQSARSP
jgi:hypothetical protein